MAWNPLAVSPKSHRWANRDMPLCTKAEEAKAWQVSGSIAGPGQIRWRRGELLHQMWQVSRQEHRYPLRRLLPVLGR